MKKILNIIPFILVMAFTFLACDEDHSGNMAFSGEVKITSFEANGIEGIIDETSTPSKITIYVPWSADLEALDTQITLSSGASINPGNQTSADLSKAVIYKVINGNLYNDYSVTAEYSKILTFSIGKYAGKIDDANYTITVKYPMGESLTNLRPSYTVTPGATVVPESNTEQDFTDPVIYTISYMGESRQYTVTVVPTRFEPVAFVGVASDAKSIENEDEKAACEWFLENTPNSEYISFDQIKNGSVDITEFKVIWWYTDGATRSLPSAATTSSVVTAFKEYYQNGGSLFLSSWAVQYVANLEIPKDGKPANNLWGETNDAEAVTTDGWGICFKGYESHPVFQGLTKPAGEDSKVYLLSAGLKVKAHNAIWNFSEDWVDYKSKDAWTTANGALGLAAPHWDNDNSGRSVLFEYPKAGAHGGVICIGSEAYDWSVVGTNTNQSNLEVLTTNIITYLQE